MTVSEAVSEPRSRSNAGMLSPEPPPRFILASGSPRRRDLLREAQLEFEAISPDVPELAALSLSVAELTTCNATRKAVAVARQYRDAVVLGADTLVSLHGAMISKPRDLAEATSILQRLCGEEHQVCTGVVIAAASRRLVTSFHVISHVQFRSIDDEQIAAYLAKINPLDKAGAYAAQGHGSEIISAIRGSYTNVVGLPMDETLQALAAFGIKPGAGSKSPACFRPDLRKRTRSN